MVPVKYHEGKFPPPQLAWDRLVPLIGPASAAVARYDGALSAIPNASVLLSPLTTQEAVLSSKIEGTQATMTEVLEYEAKGGKKDLPDEQRNDIHEVLNYRKAMWTAVESLRDLPLCSRIILEAHGILLDSVRGHNKAPGEYRKTPNWIGPHGCTVENAYFAPIDANKIGDAIGRWEKFINADQPDRLVQLAIAHAEFEAIHPFLDGNGRVGRMLVPLFMYQAGLIQSPMFYISGYFEAHRDVYYERLRAVSRDDDWTGWCSFFLSAVQWQAEENLKKTRAILDLYDKTKLRLPKLTHSQYAIHALDWIFKRPFFRGSEFVESSDIPAPTAYRILSVLCKENVLTTLEEKRGRRPGLYVFSELINVAEGQKVF